MSDKEQRGIVEEAGNIIESYSVPDMMELEEPGTGVKAVPSEVFDEYRQAPIARHGTAHLTSIESLIDPANRFKGPDSVLFGTPES